MSERRRARITTSPREILPTEPGIEEAPNDGSRYVRQSGAWIISPTVVPAWGTVVGTLSAQTDLQAALDAKSDTTHTHTLGDVTDSGALAALNTVDTSEIDNGAVTTGKVADAAITEAKIATGAVTSNKIAANAVTEAKIGSSAVTEAKISNGAVTSNKIADYAVTATQIGGSAVTESKIGSGAVTYTKLADASVGAFKLQSGAVIETKIAAGAVTYSKIGAEAIYDWHLYDPLEAKLVYKEEPVEPFMPWKGEVTGTFTNRKTYSPFELDRFLGRGSELVMDLDGSTLSDAQKNNLTNQSYTQAVSIPSGGNTGVLTIDLETNGMVGANGFVYAQGLLMITFYSGRGPVSMTCRTQDKNGTWTNRTCTGHMTSSNTPGATEPVYWGVNLHGNYLVKIELTMTSQSAQQCGIGNISYLGSRMTMSEGPQINTLGGKFFGQISGVEQATTNWTIDQDGSADFDSLTIQDRPVRPADQFLDLTGGSEAIYTVYGVANDWYATKATSSGMTTSAGQTTALPNLATLQGLTYS